MARITHATGIDVGFCNPMSDFVDLGVGVCPNNFAHQRLHLFG